MGGSAGAGEGGACAAAADLRFAADLFALRFPAEGLFAIVAVRLLLLARVLRAT